MSFWIKTPWWCVIKPIFQIISVKKNFTGTFVYITHNGELQEQTFYNGKKKVTVQLTKIPVFQYTVTLSNADKSYLMKKLS